METLNFDFNKNDIRCEIIKKLINHINNFETEYHKIGANLDRGIIESIIKNMKDSINAIEDLVNDNVSDYGKEIISNIKEKLESLQFNANNIFYKNEKLDKYKDLRDVHIYIIILRNKIIEKYQKCQILWRGDFLDSDKDLVKQGEYLTNGNLDLKCFIYKFLRDKFDDILFYMENLEKIKDPKDESKKYLNFFSKKIKDPKDESKKYFMQMLQTSLDNIKRFLIHLSISQEGIILLNNIKNKKDVEELLDRIKKIAKDNGCEINWNTPFSDRDNNKIGESIVKFSYK